MSHFQENQQQAQLYLQRYTDTITGHYINGQWLVSDNAETFENLTPVDNTALGKVVSGSASDVDAASKAAANAFDGWRSIPGTKRRQLLNGLADKIVARADEIALVESMDCGQPIRFMKQAAIRGAENFRFFADKAVEANNGQGLYQPQHTNFTVRSPIGPIAVITPWNTPFMLATWKIAPALAAGCTVVHKPAEFSPLSAAILAELSHEAGLPDGVWNMVNGMGATTGKYLTEHPQIKAIAFVGESITGSHIMAQGSATLKRIHLELGGKNPVIVFNDSDFERALDSVVFMIYSLNGQRCTASSRLLLQSGIADKFIAALEKRVQNITVGHPLDPATEVGPLIHPSHLQKVESYVELAKNERKVVVVGGQRRHDLETGNYIAPALFTNADNQMRIAREEIFGPVLTCLSFDTEQQAVAMANDSPYGLSGYIWTNDTGRALRMAHQIESGMLWINSENNRNLPSPFGGMKMSGMGRDGGDYSFDFYMETKNVCIAHGTHRIPVLGK